MPPITEAKKQSNKRYREANKEAIAEKGKEYREANKEAIANYKKEYHEANKEAIAEQKKEYREANREAITEKNNLYRKRAYDPTNPDNLDRYLLKKRRNALSKSKAENKQTTFCTEEEWLEHYHSFNGHCARTGVPFDFSNPLLRPSADRVDAGGDYVPSNIQWVIWGYNNMRKDMDAEEFHGHWERFEGALGF